jgi:cell wall-associated NlpC family hydrolase
MQMRFLRMSWCGLALLLTACASAPPPVEAPLPVQAPAAPPARAEANDKGREIVLFALGLIDTGYRFGGKNPEAGLDCSGMVSYIYNKAVGMKLVGSAADMARQGRAIARRALRPGDLVFFNTRGASFSHVGVYIGDDRFVHAPSSNGRVRIEQMGSAYFRQRFEVARSYFD